MTEGGSSLLTPRGALLQRLQALLLSVFLILPLPLAADVREGETSVRISITTNGARELPPESETRLRIFLHDDAQSHRKKRKPAAACQPSTNDSMELYGVTGWHLPSAGFPFEVNPGKAPAEIREHVSSALSAAAGTWVSADGDKQLPLIGTSTIKRPRYDGHHVVMWRSLPSRTLAAAYVWYDPATSEVIDADMVFNTRVQWSISDPASGDCGGVANTFDVRALATHEFGHWLGLDDLYESAAADLTMYGLATAQELKKATLGTGDTLGALAVAP